MGTVPGGEIQMRSLEEQVSAVCSFQDLQAYQDLQAQTGICPDFLWSVLRVGVTLKFFPSPPSSSASGSSQYGHCPPVAAGGTAPPHLHGAQVF